MKLIVRLVCTGCLLFGTAVADLAGAAADTARTAASPAIANPTGYAGNSAAAQQIVIPDDFLGLSFETSNLLLEKGSHLFSAANQPLINLFRALGIKSLRMGGGTADMPSYQIPNTDDIDNLFAFADAADVKVIYTLRMPGSDISRNVEIAKYIMQHYSSRLTCLAIGNETDFYRNVYTQYRDYDSYKADWEKQAAAIINAVPGAMFCGPNTGGRTEARSIAWTTDFARDFADTGHIALITQHYYGAGAADISSATEGRDKMLSPTWVDDYQALYDEFAVPVKSYGLAYRMEEVNSISGGVPKATDTFAAALWVLDFLHWWAAHGAAGVNIHNRRWIPNIVVYPALDGNFSINPIGYGIKAFDVGGHGSVVPLTMKMPDGMNMSAYAVRNAEALYITIINKTHDAQARAANITLLLTDQEGPASTMYLTAPDNDVSATRGITLGGAQFGDNGTWQGTWTPVNPTDGRLVVAVPPAAAVIVKINNPQPKAGQERLDQ